MRQFALVPFVLLAACGDDGGKSPTDAKAIDAHVVDALIDARVVDAPPDAAPTVTEVTCPNDLTGITTITAPAVYSPDNATIAPNGIVRFMMPSIHNVVPDTALSTDPGLNVGFNETKCLKFSTVGTFNFKCMPHQFKGHVTVQ